ncbi:MAG: OsmC family protein [Verrucomicrobiota bacterium]
MSEHTANIEWRRGESTFEYETYSRNHLWKFDNGLTVEASAAEGFLGDAANIDPEEAFVASLSSCHMLTFLAICAKKRITVETYEDRAVGHLGKDDEGSLAVILVELRPNTTFAGENPSPEELRELHAKAHHHCFIANSVKTEVVTLLDD